MRVLFAAIALLESSIALAGSGPWTLEPGEQNVYVGGDYYRYSDFHGAAGVSELATGVTASGLTGVWTYGMAYNVEVDIKLGFESVRVNDPTAANCLEPERPSDFCTPTSNLGDLAARLKWRFVDEAYGSPLSAAASLAVRSGESYASERNRLTTLGDGQSDLGAGVAIGRTGKLGKGWYVAGLDSFYWLRLPNRVDDGVKVPADEVGVDAELLVALHPRFGLGPAGSLFTRTGGQDFDVSTHDFLDLDGWNTLAGAQAKVGAKLGVYSQNNGPTLSVAVLQTVWARNNPADTLAVSVGVGQWVRTKKAVSQPPIE